MSRKSEANVETLRIAADAAGSAQTATEDRRIDAREAAEDRRLDARDAVVGHIASEEIRVTNEKTGGEKGSKIERYDLVPVDPLRWLATLYGKGAAKYSERNWEKGYDWSLSYAAMQRHLNAFWEGQDFDEETGVPHLTNAAFHAFALVTFMTTHPELDNRPSKGKK